MENKKRECCDLYVNGFCTKWRKNGKGEHGMFIGFITKEEKKCLIY